jgi:hypothetical protein
VISLQTREYSPRHVLKCRVRYTMLGLHFDVEQILQNICEIDRTTRRHKLVYYSCRKGAVYPVDTVGAITTTYHAFPESSHYYAAG